VTYGPVVTAEIHLTIVGISLRIFPKTKQSNFIRLNPLRGISDLISENDNGSRKHPALFLQADPVAYPSNKTPPFNHSTV